MPWGDRGAGSAEGSDAMTNMDVLGVLAQFVGSQQFLFFAPVSSGWRRAWGRRPAVTSYVAADSSVSQLRYSFECGLPLNRVELCTAAARLGKLELLQFARSLGYPWNERTCQAAAEGGHLDVLRWASLNGCGWDLLTPSEAAGGGNLEVLKWIRRNGGDWNDWTCSAAARAGHLNVLVWLRDNGCPWSTETCSEAARGGHLRVLLWARRNGCGWDKEKCRRFARYGRHRHVVEWIQESASP